MSDKKRTTWRGTVGKVQTPTQSLTSITWNLVLILVDFRTFHSWQPYNQPNNHITISSLEDWVRSLQVHHYQMCFLSNPKILIDFGHAFAFNWGDCHPKQTWNMPPIQHALQTHFKSHWNVLLSAETNSNKESKVRACPAFIMFSLEINFETCVVSSTSKSCLFVLFVPVDFSLLSSILLESG